ncbi:MAG: MFS transporter [Puniceicoccales bacterium]|jgi:MFS family permease|nr:MFS transporter [Puniceicoccales bacterium]
MAKASKIFEPHFPFSPACIPFFYGWVIFFSSLCGRLISVSGHSAGIAPFTEHLIATLGISRVCYSNILFFATVASSFFLPFFGRLFDRSGTRRAMTYSGIALGLTYLFFGHIDVFIGSIQRITSSTTGAVCVLFVGFFLLKLLGQNLVPLASRLMILLWYDRKSCTMMGLSGVFTSVIFGMIPPLTHLLLTHFGHLETWKILGMATIFCFVPIIWGTCRDSPQSIGLALDAEPDPAKDAVLDETLIRDKTLGEAFRTFDFWIFMAAIANSVFITNGFQIHIVDIFREMHACTSNAMDIFPPAAIISAVFSLLLGIFLDRISIRFALVATFLVGIFVAILLEYINRRVGFYVWVFFFGVNWALYGIIFSVPWAKLFGRKHLGQIMSMVSAIALFFAAIAPSIFAYARQFGSYFWVTRLLLVGSSIGFLVSVAHVLRQKFSPRKK